MLDKLMENYSWPLGPMCFEDTGASGTSGEGGEQSADNETEGTQEDGTTKEKDERIPKDQVEAIVRARLASEQKKYADYDHFANIAQKMSKITGMDAQTLLTKLDEAEAQLTHQQAIQAGLDPRVVQELQAARADAQKANESVLETNLKLEEAELKKDPLYADLEGELRDKVFEFARGNKVSLTQAYWVINGTNRAQTLRKEIEQQVTSDVKERLIRDGVLGDVGDAAKDLGLTPEELAFCRNTGQDPKEYARFKNVGNLDQYRETKKKK